MEAAENNPQHVGALKRGKGRSRVTNGSKLLPLSDGRSCTARRFRDIFEGICGDLGGPDLLSEVQKQLIRRASMLSAESERLEALWSRGEAEFNIELYTVMVNALRRVCESIGLRRVPRDAGPVTIKDYLDAKAIPDEPAEGLDTPPATRFAFTSGKRSWYKSDFGFAD